LTHGKLPFIAPGGFPNGTMEFDEAKTTHGDIKNQLVKAVRKPLKTRDSMGYHAGFHGIYMDIQ